MNKTVDGLNRLFNLVGGVAGQIPIQVGPDQTTFISPPFNELGVYLNGRPPVVRIFTSSQSYVPTVNVHLCQVEILGGGAGGSGYQSTINLCGGGGGGGSYIKTYLVPATYSITIGAGGAGGTGGVSATVGTAGGSTSFGSFTAPGGSPADTINSSGNGGVAPTGSYLSVNGQRGFIGSTGYTGYGGGNFIYPNHGPFPTATNLPANTSYGVGGSGGNNTNSGSGQAGRPGVVIVTEFY